MLALSDSVWLISGIPGAGKTSVSRALAEKLTRAAHVETDRVRQMIVSGYLAPGEEPRTESDAQLKLGAQNAALIAGFHGSPPPATGEMLALPYASAVEEASPAEGSLHGCGVYTAHR